MPFLKKTFLILKSLSNSFRGGCGLTPDFLHLDPDKNQQHWILGIRIKIYIPLSSHSLKLSNSWKILNSSKRFRLVNHPLKETKEYVLYWNSCKLQSKFFFHHVWFTQQKLVSCISEKFLRAVHIPVQISCAKDCKIFASLLLLSNSMNAASCSWPKPKHNGVNQTFTEFFVFVFSRYTYYSNINILQILTSQLYRGKGLLVIQR
jgi:hypothetical protein